MMRICLLSGKPTSYITGIDVNKEYRSMAMDLVRLGHEVEVIGLSDSKYLSNNSFDANINPGFANLPLYAELLPAYQSHLAVNQMLWHKFWKMHKKCAFDVVQVSASGAIGLLPALSGCVPVIVHFQNFLVEPTWRQNNYPAPFDVQLMTIMEYLSEQLADLILIPPDFDPVKVAFDFNLPVHKVKTYPVEDNSAERNQLAAETAALYELAQSQFLIRDKSVFYRKDQPVEDAANLIVLNHRMLTDMLYSHSWSYRIKYWLHMLVEQPQLFWAKIVLAFAHYTPFISPWKNKLIAQLSELICKQEQGKDQMLKQQLLS